MRVYLEKRVVLGLLTALAVLAGLGVISYLNNQKFAEASIWVAHTNDVLYRSEELLTAVVNAETGQRGYVITQNDVFLEPYHEALRLVNTHVDQLEKLTSDNPRQQQRIAELRSLIKVKLKTVAENIELAGGGIGAVKQKMETLEGKNVMDKIRNAIGEFQLEEKNLLKEREDQRHNDIRNFNIAFAATAFVMLAVLILVVFLINANLKARLNAEKSLTRTASEVLDLYDNAPCGYHSLDAEGVFVAVNNTLLSWLQYNKKEILNRLTIRSIINEESFKRFLEVFPAFKQQGRVDNMEIEMVRKDGSSFPVVINALAVFDQKGNYSHSRTTVFDNTERKAAEIKSNLANQELEAFTYSVSHDLRAPLRSINGYSQILDEDYGHLLDSEGKRLLTVIAKNARQMGQLIDDLLEFSGIGKKELYKSMVGMDDIVRPIANEMKVLEKQKGRKVDIIIYLMENAVVDIRLMRQVWINLISNALKYSAKKELTTLEIGSYPSSSDLIFYIKDNGVGFDMQYISKLFGVFQRLHKTQDFEGTGVGLAIVKRIVERHGGKVWAESAPGAGASFYFSIPNS